MPLVTPAGHGLGWRRDTPDHRDFAFAAPIDVVSTLPAKVDMRPDMPAVYDQGPIGCADEATEVLTNTGWKYWSDIKGIELLGTMNPADHSLEFQAPTALQRYEYDGPMHYADHRSIDFALTPTHRMYVRAWNERARTLSPDFEFKTIDNLGWYVGLPCATSGHLGIGLKSLKLGTRTWDGDDFLALLALIISDGWTGGTEHNWNRVSFCCFREDRLPIVRDLAARLGLPEIPGRPNVWMWRDPDLAAWLRANAYAGQQLSSPHKRIPDIVKTATSDQIRLFLDYYGDQHNSQSRQFYTSSHHIADDIQELLLRIGRRGSLYERAPRSTCMTDGRRIEADNCTADITITERGSDRLSLERRKNIQIERYKGVVYCATVPNSTLITRRNGSILISGNSCTANAIGGGIQFDRKKLSESPDFVPSRLFIYWQERNMEHSVPLDAGAEIRDGIKSIARYGAPPEDVWPYVPTPADPNTNLFPANSPPVNKPSTAAYTEAAKHLALSYFRVQQTITQLKSCLAQGFPFVFGFAVYSSIYDSHGQPVTVLPMPKVTDNILGGHAVLAVGYQDSNNTFIVRNSWGPNVQDAGYFYMPYAYLLDPNLSGDMWTVRRISA